MNKFRLGLAVAFSFVLANTLTGFVTTQSAMATIENEFGELTVVSNSSGVSIVWATEQDVTLQVSVDGNLVVDSEIDGSTDLLPIPHGEKVDFQLTWSRPLQDESNLPGDTSNDIESVATREPEMINEIKVYGFQLGRYAEIQIDTAVAAVLPSSTTFKYLTFINAPFVSVPLTGCNVTNPADKWFAGDDRGFDPTTQSFRTKLVVRVDWTTGGSITYNRLVHATKVYKKSSDGTMAFVESDSASISGMTVSKKSETNTLAQFRIKHDVGNPYCPILNSIYYDYEVFVARSGAYTITGFNYDVPSHEAYLIDDDQAYWEYVYRSFGNDFSTCLVYLLRESCKQDVLQKGTR